MSLPPARVNLYSSKTNAAQKQFSLTGVGPKNQLPINKKLKQILKSFAIARSLFNGMLMAMLSVFLCATVTFAQTSVTVTPQDNRAGLLNPDMGWYIHYYDNTLRQYGSRLAKGDVLNNWPGLTTCYFRLDWSNLEPQRGQYRWDLIDSVASHWIDAGKKIAFRVCAKESNRNNTATPAWVGTGYAPNDATFLAALEDFLKVYGARYDGKPYVAYVDVGTIGIWGEGWDEPSWDAKKAAIDLHHKYFPNTLLVVNDDYGQQAVDYARSLGFTIRNDSYMITQPWCTVHSYMYDPFWPVVPTIVETDHYGPCLARGSWSLACYLEMVESTHASWCDDHGWPDDFFAAQRALIDSVNLRIGYRLQVTQASWPPSAATGATIDFNLKWRNAAVAPCYKGGFPAITLKNSDGSAVVTAVDTEFDVKKLPPGDKTNLGTILSDIVRAKLPATIPNGQYQVFVSVGSKDGTPIYALPYNNSDGNHRYLLGAMTISGPRRDK
jgi:hypothetical protein